jgi:RNA polymerase sigma-70 factor, ECF subfamily
MSQEAFVQLVDAHYASLYRFALSLTRSQADACDLTQQTFYVWATKGSALRDLSKVKSWLFTTLYREFLRGRRRGERMTALDTLAVEEADPTTLEPEAVKQLDADTVVAALQDVDEVFRAPLTLFYLEELSYQEIAETLDVPIGTVMSRLSRGKTQLRVRLEAQRTAAGAERVVPFQNPKGKSSHG